jgi:hypothetical protein
MFAWLKCSSDQLNLLAWFVGSGSLGDNRRKLGHVAAVEEFALSKIYENTRECRLRKASACTARLSPIFASQTRSTTACWLL